MKINIRKSQERQVVEKLNTALTTSRTIWELLTIVTLHEEFGFGRKRLLDFSAQLQKNYNGFSREADLTDTFKQKCKATNLDTAVIRAVRALRADGIDYREILNMAPGTLVIANPDNTQVDVDLFIDRLEQREAERKVVHNDKR